LDAVRAERKEPAVVGVPLIHPLVVIDSPGGRFVDRKMIGAFPLAVTV
jgi:hypothetical protein